MLRALATCAAGVLLGAGGAGAAPAPTSPQGTVDRQGRSMAWHMTYRLPDPVAVPGTSTAPVTTPPSVPATIPMRWVAYGGSRESARLRRLGAGEVALVPRSGVVTFTRRVAVPTGGPMSGGFCAELDLAALGVPPQQPACPTGPTATRDQLSARVPEVTVIGDSVGTGLDYVSGGRAAATGRWSAMFDLKVCRRLVAPPCPPNPPSALSVIRSAPGSLGDVVVIHVGYNDWGGSYDIPRVMAALKARGVRRAVWVNLQSIAPSAPAVNPVIRRAAGRYDWLQVADWAAHSAGRGWFVADRDHLTPSGAYALAGFYRSEIARAIRALRDQPAEPAR